jgi:hypothetical protein
MANYNDKEITPNETKYGFQLIRPIANNGVFNNRPVTNNENSDNKIENIILNEEGHSRKLFKINSTINFSVWLYPTHLRIDDFNNKQTLDDISLLKLKRPSAIWYSSGIILRRKGKRYRVSWGDSEDTKIINKFLNFLAFIFKGDKRSKMWVSTIKNLKKQMKNQAKLDKKYKSL